eukprot:CAMPEP_0197055382 /NCGR_PEP_ID=MMETSP1384-20130603/63911_1 /TAXON_ID=29189 /ORGANISM="Ammonia sp." /LENGTH=138 /DNA_ID=CAMNT_0042488941 /DNA_START=69 /DNA_END=485 /DNA_ORIENTATION=+
MKTVEQAEKIIEQSKEPMWGELIKRLYRDGFDIDQIEEAFKRTNQGFKWKGQIHIWYQESRPTCIEQLQWNNGDGNRQYVRSVVRTLIEQHCKEEPVVIEPEMKVDEQKQNENPNEQNTQNNAPDANTNAASKPPVTK